MRHLMFEVRPHPIVARPVKLNRAVALWTAGGSVGIKLDRLVNRKIRPSAVRFHFAGIIFHGVNMAFKSSHLKAEL